MNLLIYGATELGYMIALRLYREHSVTLIDDLEKLPDKFNLLDISLKVLEQILVHWNRPM